MDSPVKPFEIRGRFLGQLFYKKLVWFGLVGRALRALTVTSDPEAKIDSLISKMELTVFQGGFQFVRFSRLVR